MKIRTDFVTNSSSSSFITYTIYEKNLNKFLLEMLGEDEDSCYYIDAPYGAGGCETGMNVNIYETKITDYAYPLHGDDDYMHSIFDALYFYLKYDGSKEIEKQENLNMLELLCDEVEDNESYIEDEFEASSD